MPDDRSTPTRRRRFAPRVERLDARVLPAILLPDNGLLGPVLLTGTPGDDQFLIRRDPLAPGSLFVSEDGGLTGRVVTALSINAVEVNSPSGSDTLTIDHTGLLVATNPGLVVRFFGNLGPDTLIQRGVPLGLPVRQAYTAGEVSGTGTLVTADPNQALAIEFAGLVRIVDTVPALELAIVGNTQSNALAVVDAPDVEGLVVNRAIGADRTDLKLAADERSFANLVDVANQAVVPIDFARKASVIVDALSGDDQVSVDVARSATGMVALAVGGGAGTDAILVAQAPPVGVAFTVAVDVEQRANGREATFVQGLYARELGRAATLSEVAAGVDRLRRNDRAGLVRSVITSREARTYEALSWFPRYLGRGPLAGEVNGLVNRLTANEPSDSVLSRLLTRPDLLLASDFVASLYRTVLLREPDPGPLRFYVGQANRQGRRQLALGFLRSAEFRVNQVAAYYRNILNREPDPAGLANLVNSNLDLQAIRVRFWSGQVA